MNKIYEFCISNHPVNLVNPVKNLRAVLRGQISVNPHDPPNPRSISPSLLQYTHPQQIQIFQNYYKKIGKSSRFVL